MKIWALSGFLGLPSDWEDLNWNHLIAVDWQTFPMQHLDEWARAFNAWVQSQPHDFASPKVLMGYSLGGRLALHALLDQPHAWDAAIIISAHSGLSCSEERHQRQLRDLEWAERFKNESWDKLLEAWNSQPVFASDSFAFKRKESDYQRDPLSQALIGGSLGNQEDLRQKIANIPCPILWVTGREDARFCQIAQHLTFAHPQSSWQCIEGGGHRVPWSHPHIFSEMAFDFLRKVTHLT